MQRLWAMDSGNSRQQQVVGIERRRHGGEPAHKRLRIDVRPVRTAE